MAKIVNLTNKAGDKLYPSTVLAAIHDQSGVMLDTLLSDLRNKIANMDSSTIDTAEDGFFVVDNNGYIGLRIDNEGLDVATVSDSLKRLIMDGADFSEFVRKDEMEASLSKNFELEFVGKIWDNTQAGDGTVYFPCIIKPVHAGALGKYYMFYSYDHQYGNGNNVGIKLAYSNDLIHWTKYGNVLKAITQWSNYTGSEEQETETPCVVYDKVRGKYLMYWHSSYAYDGAPYNQNTYISESDDCITWAYIKPAMTYPLSHYPGNGHDGYWQTWRFYNTYIATILMGGVNGYMTIAYSNDGLHWIPDPLLNNALNSHFKTQGTVSPNLNELAVEFNQSAFFELDGKYYKVGGAGLPSAGTAPKVYNLYVMEVMSDMKTAAGPATLLHAMNTLVGETTNVRMTTAFVDEGMIYIIYNCREGSNGACRFFLAKLKRK